MRTRRPSRRSADRTINDAHVPGTGAGEDAAIFFDALGDQLKRFPPPRADAPMLAELRTLGIGPGLHPVADGKLTDAQLQALRDAVTQGPAKMTSNFVDQVPADVRRPERVAGHEDRAVRHRLRDARDGRQGRARRSAAVGVGLPDRPVRPVRGRR